MEIESNLVISDAIILSKINERIKIFEDLVKWCLCRHPNFTVIEDIEISCIDGNTLFFYQKIKIK